jgi:hypothetical protein
MKRPPVKKVSQRSIMERIHEAVVIVFLAAVILFLMIRIIFF